MKTKPIEVKSKGLTVKIFVTRSTKENKVYTSYQVADYTQVDLVTGKRKRKLWSFADEGDARAKALELCEGNLKAQQFNDADMAQLYLEKRTIHNAMAEAVRLDMEVDDAVRLVRMATEIVPLDQILDACRFWRDRRPDKPFTPKKVKEAVTDYLSRRARLSDRRQRALKCYLDQLCEEFSKLNLHEVTAIGLKDWMDTKEWSPKTFNEVLGAYSLLWKEAQLRDWVPTGCNPCSTIKRRKLLPGKIGIFSPDQVRQILSKVKEDLIPFCCVWFFAGARKEEVARLTWAQIRSALKTGVLEIEADQGLKTGARSVTLLPNLKAWLEWYLRRDPQPSGLVLPGRFSEKRRLDDVQKMIARQSKVEWVANGGRHSFISYRCKITGSVVDVADECGNSPVKIEKHYRKRGVSLQTAQDYFNILPPAEADNVVTMGDRAIAA